MNAVLTTWRELISAALKESGERWEDVVSNTLSDKQMNRKFNDGYGSIEGRPFTVWTEKHVYFPTVYDGSEGVGVVSRIPDGKPTKHIGGE